jgi:hypothetical protein
LDQTLSQCPPYQYTAISFVLGNSLPGLAHPVGGSKLHVLTIGVLAADEMLIGLQDAPELGVIVDDYL